MEEERDKLSLGREAIEGVARTAIAPFQLLQNGIEKNLVKKDIIIESLMAFKRAGASAIITYFALDIAKKLSS